MTVMEKSKTSLLVWQIAKVNLKYYFLPLFLLSVIIILLTPVLYGTTNLDRKAAAVPLEMFVSMIGMILLVPVFHPEQDDEINDVIASKYIDSIYVYFIRIACSVMGIILLVLVFALFMLGGGCEITVPLIGGTIADAMFLGGMGLLTAALTANLPVSYMIPLLYYILGITMKSKLGKINLFAMMNGNHEPDVWLFGTGILFIVLSVLIKKAAAKK